MTRKKPSTGLPAAAFMAQSFNGGTREPAPSKLPSPEVLVPSLFAKVADESKRDAEAAPRSSAETAGTGRPQVGAGPRAFTCPECGAHEAYLLRDTLLRVTRYEPGVNLVEVESVGELTLDVECKACRCVVELGEDWTVVETGKERA